MVVTRPMVESTMTSSGSVAPRRMFPSVEDVRNVLVVQIGRLDLDYVRGWCDRHGTRELFEKLLAHSSQAP